MIMEKWWNDDNKRKKKLREDKAVPMLLYPLQIPLKFGLGTNPTLCRKKSSD
jgi:hypothetical protein